MFNAGTIVARTTSVHSDSLNSLVRLVIIFTVMDQSTTGSEREIYHVECKLTVDVCIKEWVIIVECEKSLVRFVNNSLLLYVFAFLCSTYKKIAVCPSVRMK